MTTNPPIPAMLRSATPLLALDDRRINATLATLIAVLALCYAATQLIRFRLGTPEVYGLVPLFDLGAENNLPTFFSGLLLLACALALFTLSRGVALERPTSRRWLGLAIVCFLLAADEVASLHELTTRPMRELAPSLMSGLLYWGWVVPGLVLVTLMVCIYARFILGLPAPVRNRAMLGAALFVIGAIGVEMPEARHVESHGMENLTYSAYVLVEEVLEMTGVLVVLSGLLVHLRAQVGPMTLAVTRPAR